MGVFRGTELNDVRLSDDELELRPWRPADADRVHEVVNEGSIQRYLALPDPYTRQVADDFVKVIGNAGRRDGVALGCAAVQRSSGRLVGSAELRLTGDPELGYWVARDARGLGYAARMSRLLADFGFGAGLRRIRVCCDVRNVASAKSALGAGFAFEGVARCAVVAPGHGGAPDRIGDLARFARLREDVGTPIAAAFAPLPPAGLTDGTVALRGLCEADAEALGGTEDQVALALGFTGTATPGPELARRAAAAPLDWLVGSTARMAIVDIASGRFAGVLDLRRAGPPQIGGVGYAVHPAFRGRGYTTRALRLLTGWAFGAGDFARLELGAKRDNVASQRAAASAGYQPDGVRAQRLRNPDGSFSDEIRFALLNPRFPAPNQPPPSRSNP